MGNYVVMFRFVIHHSRITDLILQDLTLSARQTALKVSRERHIWASGTDLPTDKKRKLLRIEVCKMHSIVFDLAVSFNLRFSLNTSSVEN